MILPGLVGKAFRDRFAVRRFRDGGVIIDLMTGTYLRLNLTATEICSILSEFDDVESVRSDVARRIVARPEDVDTAIAAVLDGLLRLVPHKEPVGAFRYLPSGRGYILASEGVPMVRISADGTTVGLVAPTAVHSTEQMFQYLRAIAPKLLFLQAKMVIHGAASNTTSGVRILSGESGAGKTTTARVFDSVGLKLFAEDMIIVAAASPLRVHVGGEREINSWAATSAEKLARDPSAEVDAASLHEVAAGESDVVSEIWFVDGARRKYDATQIVPRKLGETDGALAMMTSLFLGGVAQDSWRQFLSLAGQIAVSVPVYEALMPAGIDRLSAAARSYMENSAS